MTSPRTNYPGSPSTPHLSPGQLDDCNVFVKYLPSDLTEDQFHDLFKEFGDIISSKIMVDQNTGKSLGFGFVRFNDSESAQIAIKKMNGKQLENKRLLCKLANQSQHNSDHYNNILNHQTPSNNLYIKPLLPTTTEEDLRKLFEPFGKIDTCKVMIDHKTGLSRQIGFVKFETVDQAKRALEEMTTYKLEEGALPLTVKYEDTQEQKMARKSIRLTSPQVGRGIPIVPTPSGIFMYYPASPPWYGGVSYPPYPGYEYGIPFSPPNYYGPSFPMTPPNHGEGVAPSSPVFHPFSWNPEYHPSHYGPGTAYPNSYSQSNFDNSIDDSLSDDKEVEVDLKEDDNNGSPFPMFDDNNGNGENGKQEDGKKYKPTKPINIRRQDDSKD